MGNRGAERGIGHRRSSIRAGNKIVVTRFQTKGARILAERPTFLNRALNSLKNDATLGAAVLMIGESSPRLDFPPTGATLENACHRVSSRLEYFPCVSSQFA